MSIISRKRSVKQPTHNSSKRPRLRGALSKPEAVDITGWQHLAHISNKADPMRHAQGGQFGGVSRRNRKPQPVTIITSALPQEAA